MKYVVPLLCDSNKQPVGLFTATTSEGELVIVFSNTAKWDRFADAVALVLKREQQYLGAATLEAGSFESVVEKLTGGLSRRAR